MNFVEIEKYPFSIGENAIVGFKVEPLNLIEFCKVLKNVVDEESTETIEKRLHRARMIRQVACVDKNKGEHKLDQLSLLTLPAVYAKPLRDALTDDVENVGKIISKGDGISTPILYQLSKPIKLSTDATVTELEIQAKTYADIEGVILEDMSFLQVLALLEHCSLPVLPEGSTPLLAMPSHALDQISMIDGATLVAQVLPSFLE